MGLYNGRPFEIEAFDGIEGEGFDVEGEVKGEMLAVVVVEYTRDGNGKDYLNIKSGSHVGKELSDSLKRAFLQKALELLGG